MSKIQWTDKVWNPVTGCTKVSAGCKNCYAERIADRKLPGGGFTDRSFTDVRCHPERLNVPLRWRKPRKVFVNSMSDLFHKDVPDEFILAVFGAMACAPQHTFQVLTKRPERMLSWISSVVASDWPGPASNRCVMAFEDAVKQWPFAGRAWGQPWPLPNVWLGVSVEDQKTADERIPLLLQTPAAVRFVSYEPALGPVDFDAAVRSAIPGSLRHADGSGLDWLIVGGESGPGARPCDVAWIRSAVEQCQVAGVPVFVKQMGSRITGVNLDGPPYSSPPRREGFLVHWACRESNTFGLCDRKGGDPAEWPDDLRVRQFPQERRG